MTVKYLHLTEDQAVSLADGKDTEICIGKRIVRVLTNKTEYELAIEKENSRHDKKLALIKKGGQDD